MSLSHLQFATELNDCRRHPDILQSHLFISSYPFHEEEETRKISRQNRVKIPILNCSSPSGQRQDKQIPIREI